MGEGYGRNKRDCCAARINGVKVYLDGVLVHTIKYHDAQKYHIPVSRIGKTVRIVSNGKEHLQLAEVQVYGFGGNFKNIAHTGKATQSDSYSSFSTADKAIDGNRDGFYSHKSLSHTKRIPGWWSLALPKPTYIGH